MNQFGEQPRFEIKTTIEQRPFENPAVQSFFNEWCEINDSIRPQIVDRNEWQKRGIKGILEKRSDGKKTLFIPKDLQLWEMIGMMEVVDYDTFATKPELREEAKDKLLALAKTFQNAGTYIAQRISKIHEGQEIAKALAQEFYEYGQSLTTGNHAKISVEFEDIQSKKLTPEETTLVDRFLAGDVLYKSRHQKVETLLANDPTKKAAIYETARQKTLAQFFRVAEEAFILKSQQTSGKLKEGSTQLKPWQDSAPVHEKFLSKVEKAMIQKIETPRRAFEMAIFRRGIEKLSSEMRERGWKHAVNNFFENIGLDLQIEQKKLVDILRLPELKAELEAARLTGDVIKISQKEREIANKIQNTVSSFPYQQEANNPSEIVAKQYINCVGASTLGGALMKEVGLNYLVGDVPEHSILLLITGDGGVEWRDMLNASLNKKLTDDMIESYKEGSSPLTVKDIAAFSHSSTPAGLMFDIKKDKINMEWVGSNRRQYVTVFDPEYGLRLQILNNTGHALNLLGRHKEAVEAYQQGTALDPNNAYLYNGLGMTLSSLDRYEEAIEAYRKSIAINPNYEHPYNGLGNVLLKLGRYEEAIEAYRKSIAINPKNEPPYNGLGVAYLSLKRYEEASDAFQQGIAIDPKYADLFNGLGNTYYYQGRTEEAIKAFGQFIKIADKNNDPELIKKAKRKIAELENKKAG